MGLVWNSLTPVALFLWSRFVQILTPHYNMFAYGQKLLLHLLLHTAAMSVPSGNPGRCRTDIQWLPFLVHCGCLCVVHLWLMEDHFRCHYADGQPELCGDRVSLIAGWWTAGTEKRESACRGAFLLIIPSKVPLQLHSSSYPLSVHVTQCFFLKLPLNTHHYQLKQWLCCYFTISLIQFDLIWPWFPIVYFYIFVLLFLCNLSLA